MKYIKLACIVCAMILPMADFAQGIIRRSTPTKSISPTKQVRKDNNQKKVFVFHQDGVYRVIFKEVKDVKENDLRDIVQYAKKNGRKILVHSQQDFKTGSAATNQIICDKRAYDVADFLIHMGVDASQIQTLATGCVQWITGWRGFCVVSVEEKVEDNEQGIEEAPKE